MSTYIRIVDANNEHYNGWKEPYMRGKLSTKDFHISIAQKFTKNKVDMKTSYLKWFDKEVAYPVRVQVVKKLLYKNGNVTKNVIYEKTIE